MASGRLDLFIAKVPTNTVVITLNCLDSSAELMEIPRNVSLTLEHGKARAIVHVQYLEGRECFADFIELSYVLARRLQLQPLRRYELTYNKISRTMTIQPSPISDARVYLTSHHASYLSIGYELISKLGIPERQGLPLTIQINKILTRLRLQVPANLSDDRIRLPATTFTKWKLAPNRLYVLKFDQRYSVLSISPISST
ncbi:MAG: hypothetical protein P0Y55_08695 [Candidatus Cohnella colombiensis]|uniref:Uncharacterized protein n=1 Tax=Candidatus Cohnella colombiensis TaxID=3121368 RepID=A0AA95JHL2_9BACL|nr:MAG: hypothetical protein P0Y55_08695 [Cohnella sp.]